VNFFGDLYVVLDSGRVHTTGDVDSISPAEHKLL
jgi:hypothetical protein